jgi:hypothetical protein
MGSYFLAIPLAQKGKGSGLVSQVPILCPFACVENIPANRSQVWEREQAQAVRLFGATIGGRSNVGVAFITRSSMSQIF